MQCSATPPHAQECHIRNVPRVVRGGRFGGVGKATEPGGAGPVGSGGDRGSGDAGRQCDWGMFPPPSGRTSAAIRPFGPSP